MNRKTLMLTGLLVAFAWTTATNASAQILDGEYWKAAINGKTRVVTVAPGGPKGNPVGRELLKGKLRKETVYLQSHWQPGTGTYSLDAWTDAGGLWVLAEDAGTLAPFGEGYPDSEDAGLTLTLDLNPTPVPPEGGLPPEGGPPPVVVSLQGLVSLKIKEEQGGTGAPGVDEVQTLDAGGATGGTFTLSFDGATTAALPFDISPASLQFELQSLSTIGTGNILVQGPGPFLLTFSGSLGLTDVSQILVDSDSTTGGAGVMTSVSTQGMSPGLPLLRSASFKLLGVGSTMVSPDFGGVGNDMIGNPKFSGSCIDEDKLPFSVSERP